MRVRVLCLLDRLGRETEREREHGPTPWLTAQQRNGTRQSYAALCVVLLRHLPAWTPATPTLAPPIKIVGRAFKDSSSGNVPSRLLFSFKVHPFNASY